MRQSLSLRTRRKTAWKLSNNFVKPIVEGLQRNFPWKFRENRGDNCSVSSGNNQFVCLSLYGKEVCHKNDRPWISKDVKTNIIQSFVKTVMNWISKDVKRNFPWKKYNFFFRENGHGSLVSIDIKTNFPWKWSTLTWKRSWISIDVKTNLVSIDVKTNSRDNCWIISWKRSWKPGLHRCQDEFPWKLSNYFVKTICRAEM